MRLSNVVVFDETITGAGPIWNSSDEFNDALGAADILAIQASVTSVSGTSPTLTVQLEHCADGQNWTIGPTVLTYSISSNNGYSGFMSPSASYVPLGYVRLRIALGGTSPSCRARISVTTRSY